MSEEKECPNGCGPMVLYESDDEDAWVPFYECQECGHDEDKS